MSRAPDFREPLTDFDPNSKAAQVRLRSNQLWDTENCAWPCLKTVTLLLDEQNAISSNPFSPFMSLLLLCYCRVTVDDTTERVWCQVKAREAGQQPTFRLFGLFKLWHFWSTRFPPNSCSVLKQRLSGSYQTSGKDFSKNTFTMQRHRFFHVSFFIHDLLTVASERRSNTNAEGVFWVSVCEIIYKCKDVASNGPASEILTTPLLGKPSNEHTCTGWRKTAALHCLLAAATLSLPQQPKIMTTPALFTRSRSL